MIERWTPNLVSGGRSFETRARTILEAAAGGRHAQLERCLREAEGRCARRHDHAGAGEAALALGRLLLGRGQLGEAARAFDTAHLHFEGARLAARAICAGIFTGLLHTDAGRFCEGEAALRAAGLAASTIGDQSGQAFANQALARCLVWQTHYDEAIECLRVKAAPAARAGGGSPDPLVAEWRRLGAAGCARERMAAAVPVDRSLPAVLPGEWPIAAIDMTVAHACLLARASILSADLAAAGRATAEARTQAERTGRPVDMAAVCRVKALLFAALGDLPSTRQQVQEGLDAARRAHDPLRALRLRVLLAEALVRDGCEAEARPLLARLARLESRRLPAVVARPLERLLRGDADAERPRRARGLVAIPAQGGLGVAVARVSSPPLAEAVIELLNICQSVEDEREALRRVAGALRARVRATSVACVASEADRAVVIVNEGGSHPADAVALRAIETGLAIPPTSSRSGLEAAVPIRFAGTAVGAFACRWAADVPPDWVHAGMLLTAAAAAVAPWLRAMADRRAVAVVEPGRSDILGVSDAVRVLREETARAARAPFNVVIEGESGSGKELVARAIHRLGPRASRPLCALNCAALSDELVEAELFGHARGAFTGAVGERKGLFEEAHQGTLVLDEVGELTPRAQAKLLRAIQEGEVRRVGENVPRAVDVRIVSATNRSLRAAVDAGIFRCDLLYRLEVIRIHVPPLRARVEDIPVLAVHFWQEATARLGSRSTLAPATLAALARYDWPGNVRELQNVMAALAVAVGRRGSVGPERLPAIIARQAAAHPEASSLDEARRLFEAAFVRAALAKAGGRRAQAALGLGLTRQGLAKLMVRLGIE